MSKHSVVKAGLGLGLMAASLGASAQLHTFAEPMIFYKVSGASVNYVAFLPNIYDSGIVMLDLFQSGSISTWNFGVGGAVDAAAGGQVWSFTASAGTSGSFTSVYYDPLGRVSTASTAAGSPASLSSSWYGGNASTLSMAFMQQQTISSQACNVTFGVSVGTDDYMRYGAFTIAPGNWPTASANVTFRTKSGASATDTTTMAFGDWNAINFSATSAFPTFSAYSVPNAANGAANQVAVSALTKANLCTNIYTTKSALNAAGNVIGATTGLMRLW